MPHPRTPDHRLPADTAPRPSRDSASVQYDRLRREILSGQLSPGTVLLETAVSERLGVSRTPVREALGRLAQEGLIERDRRGYRVRTRSPQEVLDIYEARIALESTCAAAAAQRSQPYDLARLRHISDQAHTTGDIAELDLLNAAWHRALRGAARNGTIVDLLERLDSLLAIYDTNQLVRSDLDANRTEHDRILAAVQSGDAEAAHREMAAHLGRTRDLRLVALAADPS